MEPRKLAGSGRGSMFFFFSFFLASFVLFPQCKLSDLGIGREPEDNTEEIFLLVAGNYFLNLADLRVAGNAIYFEDPSNRANTWKRAYQVRFQPGRTQPPNRPDSIRVASLTRQTMVLSPPPNPSGEFEAFLKYGTYTGRVYDANRQMRGEFSFHLVRDEEGIPRIRERFIQDTLFIRMSATRLGPAGQVDESGPAGSVDEENFGDEPNPELFN